MGVSVEVPWPVGVPVSPVRFSDPNDLTWPSTRQDGAPYGNEQERRGQRSSRIAPGRTLRGTAMMTMYLDYLLDPTLLMRPVESTVIALPFQPYVTI